MQKVDDGQGNTQKACPCKVVQSQKKGVRFMLSERLIVICLSIRDMLWTKGCGICSDGRENVMMARRNKITLRARNKRRKTENRMRKSRIMIRSNFMFSNIVLSYAIVKFFCHFSLYLRRAATYNAKCKEPHVTYGLLTAV